MEIFFISIAVMSVAVMGFALTALFWRVPAKKKVKKQSALLDENLLTDLQREMADFKESFHGRVNELSDQFSKHLESSNNFLSETQKDYHKTFSQVESRLGEIHLATKSMLDIGKDISSLQNILKAPKVRGGIGEMFLAELLRQILPEDHFTLQYGFKTGAKVDAVIRLGDSLIPVDAKFPLESFKKMLKSEGEEVILKHKKTFVSDVKSHIDEIAAKYILPKQGTVDFAMMYIPAENIYYETIIKDDKEAESLSMYALQKHVIPVSPNSFYAYLQSIARGLKGLRIEHSAQQILEQLSQFEGDLNRVMVDFEKLGSHLGNAQSAYERSHKKIDRLQTRIGSLEIQDNKSLLESTQKS